MWEPSGSELVYTISDEEYRETLCQEEAGRLLGEQGTGVEEQLKPSSSEESGYQVVKTSAYAKSRLKSPPPKGLPVKGGTPPAKIPKFVLPKPSASLGMTKVAQSGIRKVAGAPVKKETGPAVAKGAAGAPDPVMESTQLMAHALRKLTNQMQDMSVVIKDLQKEDKHHPTKAVMAPRLLPDLPPSGLTGPFYAVARGLKGHQGIYGTWSECASWVQGVPGNVFQKCSNLELANEFIQQFNIGQMDRKREAKGNLFWEGPEDIGNVERMTSSGPYAQGEQAFRTFLDQGSGGIKETQPPLQFFGPDPSVKKEEEFYRYDVSSEWDVNKILLSEGMEAGVGKSIAQAVTDVVSLPDGYQSNSGNEEEGLALFTQSMAEMAHGSKADAEIVGRPNFNWRASGRTSLKSVTSAAKLQKRLKTLVKLGRRVRRQSIKLLCNGLKRAVGRMSRRSWRGRRADPFITLYPILWTPLLNDHVLETPWVLNGSSRRSTWSTLRAVNQSCVAHTDCLSVVRIHAAVELCTYRTVT
jgi:hypothetical protein